MFWDSLVFKLPLFPCDYRSPNFSRTEISFFYVFFRSMINRTYSGGQTGDIKLDTMGDRVNAAYDIFNLKEENGVKFLSEIGRFDAAGNVSVKQNEIIWPGNKTDVPKGVFVSNHLRVGF